MFQHIRSTLAALAAVGVIGATGVVGVASAGAAGAMQTRSPEVQNPRLPVGESPTIAGVKATGTHGPAGGSLYTGASCDNFANVADDNIAAGLKALYGGDMAGAAEKFGEAVKVLNEGEEVGCTFA